MHISPLSNNFASHKTSFKADFKQSRELDVAMENAPTRDLVAFARNVKALKQLKDNISLSLYAIRSKFFIKNAEGNTTQFTRVLPEFSEINMPYLPDDSPKYLEVLDKNEQGSFIDKEGKELKSIDQMYKAGMEKMGFVPVWNDSRQMYEAKVDYSKIKPMVDQEHLDEMISYTNENLKDMFPEIKRTKVKVEGKSREALIAEIKNELV